LPLAGNLVRDNLVHLQYKQHMAMQINAIYTPTQSLYVVSHHRHIKLPVLCSTTGWFHMHDDVMLSPANHS